MNEIWIEKSDGYFFPKNAKMSPAILAKLKMLFLEGLAEDRIYGIFISFEKSVLLSDEDAELLKFPPQNPYRLSIRTSGILGKPDFKYILEIIRPDGQFFISPQINGALLHIDSEIIYRLNADQYELVQLTQDSNKNISKLNQKQAMTYSLKNIYQIQQHAISTEAKLETFLSPENMKIIVPDGLDVKFQEISKENFQIQPVLLSKNNNGNFSEIGSENFQEIFSKRRDVSDVYVDKNRTRYIFSEKIQKGLQQIKSVPKLSKADKERYSLQPKELFSEEIFHFSDRIIGIDEVPPNFYYGKNFYKIDWFGDISEKNEQKNFSSDVEEKTDEKNLSEKIFALKIKPNFERIDYVANKNLRQGNFFENPLNSDVKLLQHQLDGVKKILNLWQKGLKGVLLADDMGLGKTLQTLAFIAGLKKCCSDYLKINNPVLIVAPTALLSNWKSEYKKFVQKNIFSSIIDLHGNFLKNFMSDELTPNNRKKLRLIFPKNTLALTTYETLRDYQFSFAEVDWSCIVADEIQKIKNPRAGITTALKAMNYDYTIGLSGTPVENSWIDLWSIMDFLQPAWLGDLKSFEEKFLKPLQSDSSEENIKFVGKNLKNALSPIFIRRMKNENLPDIPSKKIFYCREEMPEYQKKCYFSILESVRRKNNFQPLKIIAELKNISLHPDLNSKSLSGFFSAPPDKIISESARLKKTFEILEEIKNRGEKAIIFVVSKKMQLILVHLLEKKFKIKLLPPINGEMTGEKRKKFIDEFNNFFGFNVLVLSPEAAGFGFTITSANNVIHLSRTWNPAKENQATDRAYRIGQKKDVNVFIPLACHKNFGESFDEKLNFLLNHKKILSENVLFPTNESDSDGIALFQSIKPKNKSEFQTVFWNIESIDTVTGDAFEKIIAELYDSIEGFSAKKTPHSNDNGADVVAISEKKIGFLIQCKHTENIKKNLGKRAIQEIFTAVAAYENIYRGIKFQPMVITNACGFSTGAVDLAKDTNVKLISRSELVEMLTRYKILKF